MNSTEAKENLNEEKGKLKHKFAILFEEKINAYEKSIGQFKARIANETKEDIVKYEKKMAEFEKKITEMKTKLKEYTEEGVDKWDSFKLKFDQDLDNLGKALKNFTIKSK